MWSAYGENNVHYLIKPHLLPGRLGDSGKFYPSFADGDSWAYSNSIVCLKSRREQMESSE